MGVYVTHSHSIKRFRLLLLYATSKANFSDLEQQVVDASDKLVRLSM